jgi:hypothetical protein
VESDSEWSSTLRPHGLTLSLERGELMLAHARTEVCTVANAPQELVFLGLRNLPRRGSRAFGRHPRRATTVPTTILLLKSYFPPLTLWESMRAIAAKRSTPARPASSVSPLAEAGPCDPNSQKRREERDSGPERRGGQARRAARLVGHSDLPRDEVHEGGQRDCECRGMA